MPLLTLPHTIDPNTEIVASEHQANYDAIRNLINSGLDAENFTAAVNDKLALSSSSVVRRGKSIIATSENTTATSDVLLATPDRISNLVLPTDGLIIVNFQLWLSTNNAAGSATVALYLGANRVQTRNPTGTVFVEFSTASTSARSIMSKDDVGIADMGAVSVLSTTGQHGGGPVTIFAAAGTYDVMLKYRNGGSGAATVASNRRLYAQAVAY